MSKIIEYKENCLDLSNEDRLPKGKYVIVPSCKHAGDLGRFYLNIYFTGGTNNFSVEYVNCKQGELDKFKNKENKDQLIKEYLNGQIIAEENENDEEKYEKDKDFLKIL